MGQFVFDRPLLLCARTMNEQIKKRQGAWWLREQGKRPVSRYSRS